MGNQFHLRFKELDSLHIAKLECQELRWEEKEKHWEICKKIMKHNKLKDIRLIFFMICQLYFINKQNLQISVIL